MSTAPEGDSARVEEEIQRTGREVLAQMQGAVPDLFDRRHWEALMLDWAMGDREFKTDLFRFVDVLPSLTSARDVAGHLRAYLLKDGRQLPGLPAAVSRAASTDLLARLAALPVRKNVEHLARRFIVGRDAAEALGLLEDLHRHGIAFTVDLLGETTLSAAEAAEYQRRYLDLVENLPEQVAAWPPDPGIDRNHLGALPRACVSLKVSSLDPHLDAADPVGGVARLLAVVRPVALAAQRSGASIHLDMEHWELHEITLDLFEGLATDPELSGWPHLGLTVQTYLEAAQGDLQRVLEIARVRGTPLAVRLCKGAYWDTEVLRARQHGYSCPVFRDKGSTDANFETATAFLLQHLDWLQPAFASHNLRSLLHAAALARERGLPQEAIEFQTLHGMAEPERAALRSLGYRVRVYAPVGELIPGMAYLVRRLLENTSNEGFLRLTHREGVDPEALLAPPIPQPQADGGTEAPGEDAVGAFRNCPLIDFTDPEQRRHFAEAVARTMDGLPLAVPVAVGAEPARFPGRAFEHPCPSRTHRVATRASLATTEEADDAVSVAAEAWPEWRDRPLAERAGLLEDLANCLADDRHDLAALEVAEVAKPWREADADVAEAIDHCRFAATQARIELAPRPLGTVPGEDNRLLYQGVGPAVVISPWNFPLALPAAMVSAALVAGNTVILKPAEQACSVGYALYQRALRVGFPPTVLQFLPGRGEETGDQLVRDPRVALVAFTGSRAVGLSITEKAAKALPGQRHLKRVLCEMGGKNAVIVDADADLDAAVAGILAGALGYAGQKCSACSRVITVGAIHEAVVARLVEAFRSVPVGPAELPGFRLGPVIDRDAWDRLRALLDDPGAGARNLYRGTAPEGGCYVPAVLFEVDDLRHRLMQEELFGPVVAVYRAESYPAALSAAVATPYALTGAVYSRNPEHLALARQRFLVGNLYLNRTCTGAMVGRQPFGGFGMSGTDAKTGGPGYLLHFANPRCVTENTVRRGFSPEVQI